MDPITIATTIGAAAKAAKTAWDAGECLYLFIKSTQTVSKTVQDLANSVKAFGDTCGLVRSSLETLEAAYESNKGSFMVQFGSDQLVWRGIQARLEECQEIIEELRKSMSNVAKEQASFLGQAWRQFKFNMKQEDRVVIQARLQNHTTALSLSLQAIKIRVDHLIPRQADNDLLKELQELRTLINKNNQDTDQIKPTDDLVQYAQTTFDDGATLYKASVAEGSVTDDTEIATIMGEFRQNNSDWINQWSAKVPTSSWEHGSSLASLSSEPGLSDRPALSTADTTVDDDRLFFTATVQDNCDSDDDFDLEIAKHTIEDGLKAFEVQDFEEADAILSDAVQQLQRIPEHRRSVCSLSDLRYKLAVCSYNLKPPSEAAKRLLAFVQTPSETDEDRDNVCKAGHLLAQAYVRLNKMELAQSTCDSALRGRRRLFGQRLQDYHESIALMSRIMKLQGNDVRSNTLLKQIPEDQRQCFSSKFNQLNAPAEPAANGLATISLAREQFALRARGGSTSAPKLDLDDPSVLDLLLMGITEDEIMESEDFINFYLENNKATAVTEDANDQEVNLSQPSTPGLGLQHTTKEEGSQQSIRQVRQASFDHPYLSSDDGQGIAQITIAEASGFGHDTRLKVAVFLNSSKGLEKVLTTKSVKAKTGKAMLYQTGRISCQVDSQFRIRVYDSPTFSSDRILGEADFFLSSNVSKNVMVGTGSVGVLRFFTPRHWSSGD